MYVEQLYTGCIAVGTYYIESNGEAAIIDPLRDPEPYMVMAAERGVNIKYVFVTHFHADFVSGHVDLAQKTGATIVFGPSAKPGYKIHEGSDNEIFKIGGVELKLLHTPGHTMESSSFLLFDENGIEHAIFTGDALFLGDVGRPDLAIKSDLTQEDLAGFLFDSLRNKIMPLPDRILVYPNHGAGSACGKSMSKDTVDTLGNQKLTNYALRADMTKAEFVKEILTGLTPPPQYFPKNAMMNIKGTNNFDDVLAKGMRGLSCAETEEKMNEGCLVLDTRPHAEFQYGYVPGSMSIGLDGNFAMWVGALIEDITQPIVIITESGREREAVTRLSRVGYDNCVGYLIGGFDAWKTAGKDIETINVVHPRDIEFIKERENGINIIDVRAEGEWEAQHLVNAEHFPLARIHSNLTQLDKNKKMYFHCAAGYRSMMAVTIIKNYGYKNENLVNIDGGFSEILKSDLEVTDYICPSTTMAT
jgi:glyoxylase-like metal-dependent hydrolase (beta-lactamase superfamily II)/rhodanese-related sulfurtransferase